MNWILLICGIWIIFDGTVSATYFAHIDKTTKNWYDQAVRVVRTIVGVVVLALGAIL